MDIKHRDADYGRRRKRTDAGSRAAHSSVATVLQPRTADEQRMRGAMAGASAAYLLAQPGIALRRCQCQQLGPQFVALLRRGAL